MSKSDSFHFDKTLKTWVCPVHGDVGDDKAWVRCWAGCDDGEFDGHEEDPLWYEPGEYYTCSECKGNGGWTVCGVCQIDNPDAEY